MANFEYSAKDMDRLFIDVIGQDLKMSSFGLSETDYKKIENMDYYLTEYKTFDSVDFTVEIMDLYARCHIWNNYTFQTEDITLRQFLDHYHTKVQRFHPTAVVPKAAPNGNVLEYLKSFMPEWLNTVGW